MPVHYLPGWRWPEELEADGLESIDHDGETYVPMDWVLRYHNNPDVIEECRRFQAVAATATPPAPPPTRLELGDDASPRQKLFEECLTTWPSKDEHDQFRALYPLQETYSQVLTRLSDGELAALAKYLRERKRKPPTLKSFEGEGKETLGLTISEIEQRMRQVSWGWPKRVDDMLFVLTGGVQLRWLRTQNALFAWLGCQFRNGVAWGEGVDMVSKGEYLAHLQATAQHYDAVEPYPHEPLLPRHYYAHPLPTGGDGTALAGLLKRFCPQTELDKALIEAAFLTALWGGTPGSRPAFLVTSDAEDDNGKGRGVGKSKLAQMIAQLCGGLLDFKASTEADEICKRLLSPEGRLRRVTLIDNIKSLHFSWDTLEAMITSDTISGRQMYQGEGRRPNTLVWFLTINGANLSKDLAQRVIVIKLARPVYSDARGAARACAEDRPVDGAGDPVRPVDPRWRRGGLRRACGTGARESGAREPDHEFVAAGRILLTRRQF